MTTIEMNLRLVLRELRDSIVDPSGVVSVVRVFSK